MYTVLIRLSFSIVWFNFDIIVAGKIPRIKRNNPYNAGIRNPMQNTPPRKTAQREGIRTVIALYITEAK